MTSSKLRKSTLCALTVLVASVSVVHTANAQPYWKDSSGKMVRTGFGECWRTINWTTANSLPECEGGVAKTKPSDSPKPAASAKPVAAAVIGDKDGDGIKDNVDQCPTTPAGTEVDAKGCAKDSDGDGIVDAKDECPNTAKGKATNSRGCELKESIDLSNVEFETGTSKLDSSSQSDLNEVAKVLIKNDHMKFEVAGHTDNTGSHGGNVRLSQKRADAVKSYLVSKGVASGNLTAKGYGPDKPVADNASADGRARNRRVELVLQ